MIVNWIATLLFCLAGLQGLQQAYVNATLHLFNIAWVNLAFVILCLATIGLHAAFGDRPDKTEGRAEHAGGKP